jgi:hypothetical protein
MSGAAGVMITPAAPLARVPAVHTVLHDVGAFVEPALGRRALDDHEQLHRVLVSCGLRSAGVRAVSVARAA